MGKIVKEAYDNWAGGVNTSYEPDQIPDGSYVQGKNTALTSIGGNNAVLMKRLGCATLNSTPVTGSTAVVGQHEFRKLDLNSGAFTPYHLLVSDSGRLDQVDSDGELTTISATAFTASTTQDYLPDFADANNLCFMVNGTDKKKFDGSTLSNFGLTKPSTAPTLGDSGVAGSHNGTYEGYVTFFNSLTGAESSAGTISSTVTVSNKRISWSAIPVSTDPQVTRRYLYIRNTATQANYYLALVVADNTSTTATTNLLDSSLITIGPDGFENEPPPDGVRFLSWHRSRLFAASDFSLYYSKPKKPEAFDPANFEPVNPVDGQKITGIYSMFDLLVIFKTDGVYALVGDNPDTWQIRLIDPSIGCASHRSICTAGGSLFWWGDKGPAGWNGAAAPRLIATDFIARTIDPTVISNDPLYIGKIVGAVDPLRFRVVWGIPEFGKDRNTLLLPFNYHLARWESNGWDPLDVASMATVLDAAGQPFIILGGYSGQTFKLWSGATDGVAPTTTFSGSFVATANTQTLFSDFTAAFDTIGGGLVERKVTVVDANGKRTDTTRPRIISNTPTTFTLVSEVGGLQPGVTYYYHIGGPAFDFESRWMDQGDAFLKKRYMFVYTALRPTNAVRNLLVNFYLDFVVNPLVEAAVTQNIYVAGGGLWDIDLWDLCTWDGAATTADRFRVARTGRALMVRIQHYLPNVDFALLKLGLETELLGERLG